MPSAVIFDMDGLLVDSEPLWVRGEIEVLGRVGVTLTEEDCLRTKGLRTDDIVGYWYARRRWEGASPADVEEQLVARMVEVIGAEGRALPGAHEAIAVARREGRRVALASASPLRIIEATLARVGLAHAFDVTQSAHGLPLGKPHPGIFLRTAELLSVPAERCLVLEDSLTGVIAAKAARMTCIAVPFGYPHHDARFVLADAVVGSLEDLTSELVDSLRP